MLVLWVVVTTWVESVVTKVLVLSIVVSTTVASVVIWVVKAGEVTVMVVVVVGVATVVVDRVTPTQEQALEYPADPEQADAYDGMLDGVTVT